MNIHHLELFYYVATHGGISRAVRHMPYGIQQPAVSGQILQLEEELGVRLFERVPFKLTSAGEELFAAIKPFFDNLEGLAARISKKNVARLRIGAAEMVLANYLPPILQKLRKAYPDFRLGLRTMGAREMEQLFSEKEIDVALSPIDRRPPPRLRRELLVGLPLALLVPKSSRYKTADELLASDLPEEPLICLPPNERMCSLFHGELKRREVEWPTAIEASSLALLMRYVENGYGVGLTAISPELAKNRLVRVLPLQGFPTLELFAIWQPEENPLVNAFLDEVRHYVRSEWSGHQPRA